MDVSVRRIGTALPQKCPDARAAGLAIAVELGEAGLVGEGQDLVDGIEFK